MKRSLALAGVVVVALVASVLVGCARPPGAGFSIRNGRLLDANGKDFVMRGVNDPHAWFPNETGTLGDIKSLRANTARVVLSSGDNGTLYNSPADVAATIARCKQHRLICVLELHNTTGYPSNRGSVTLDRAVDYWMTLKDVMAGQEKFILLNIGNEPLDNDSHREWVSATSNAVRRLRSAGFKHTIMVDGPGWGQDWSLTMRDNAVSVFASDPARNLIFSIHMYGVFPNAAKVDSYLESFVAAGLPILVGEFGDNHSDGNPDENAIMAAAQRLRLGYLGWSWSGNGDPVGYLDLVEDFDVNRLSPWGERLFNGPNGIRDTSQEASVYR